MQVENFRFTAAVAHAGEEPMAALLALTDRVQVEFLKDGSKTVACSVTGHDLPVDKIFSCLEREFGAPEIFAVGNYESTDLLDVLKWNRGDVANLSIGLPELTSPDGTAVFSPRTLRERLIEEGATDAMATGLTGYDARHAEEVHDVLIREMELSDLGSGPC